MDTMTETKLLRQKYFLSDDLNNDNIVNTILELTFKVINTDTVMDITREMRKKYTERVTTSINHCTDTPILIPILFEQFIRDGLVNKWFSKAMTILLENADITLTTWLTKKTINDIISDVSNNNDLSNSTNKILISIFEDSAFSDICNMPNICDVQKCTPLTANVLITDINGANNDINIDINNNYKKLIKKLRRIEKDNNIIIREQNANLTWSNTKLVSTTKELDFIKSKSFNKFINDTAILTALFLCFSVIIIQTLI